MSTRKSLPAHVGVLAATVAVTPIALAFTGTGDRALAQSVTVSPLAGALGFNAFIQNDTNMRGLEADGPVAMGGDLIIQGDYNVATQTTGTFVDGSDAQPSALVVGGQVVFNQDPNGSSIIRVLNNGYVKVGDLTGTDVRNTDQNNASVNTRLVASGQPYEGAPRVELTVQQPEGSVGPTSPIDFDAAFDEFRANAALLTTCIDTVVMKDPNGATVDKGAVAPNQQIRIELESGVTNILNVTGADLNKRRT